MAKKDFDFTCTEACSLFEKHESCHQLVLLTLFTPFLLFSLFCFVVGFFFLFFCLPSREGASPLWLTSSPWSNRNQTTAWAPQRALLKGPSDRLLKKGVFSQLPSTINTNQQDDLGFCSPMPDGP